MLNEIPPSSVGTPSHFKMPETGILNTNQLIKKISRTTTLIKLLLVGTNNEEQRVLAQRRDQRYLLGFKMSPG